MKVKELSPETKAKDSLTHFLIRPLADGILPFYPLLDPTIRNSQHPHMVLIGKEVFQCTDDLPGGREVDEIVTGVEGGDRKRNGKG